jgi:squalene-associated FAD-dependent desaturase
MDPRMAPGKGVVHVIGAGLAGLSAALGLARAGRAVRLHEAAPQAGGRCRSYHDDRLGCVIDNGGHVLMGANRAAFAYLDAVGGRAAMVEVAPAAYPFLDLASGETWTVRPNAGPLPWWVLAPGRRVPGTRLADYLQALGILRAAPGDVVTRWLKPGTELYRRLWDPLATAVMNADPHEAAALPMARMVRETFFAGEAACRPWVARAGLSRAFVDPALAVLARHGASVRTEHRVQRIALAGDRATALAFADETVTLGPDDAVVVAVPHAVAPTLLPGLVAPDDARAIVNAHFRLDRPARLPSGLPLLGLVGGTAQWLIVHDDIVSVTVSAAGALVDQPNDAVVAALWRDVARAMGLAADRPAPARLIKEKRATFAQTPAQIARRPGPRTAWRNVALAGDWTATGLPATIESAIRSGTAAADLVLGRGGA